MMKLKASLNNLTTDLACGKRKKEMYSLSTLQFMRRTCLKTATDYNNAGSCILFNDQITCNEDV